MTRNLRILLACAIALIIIGAGGLEAVMLLPAAPQRIVTTVTGELWQPVHADHGSETAVTADSNWLSGLRRYLVVTAIANLFWETAHLPLYTVSVMTVMAGIAYTVYSEWLNTAVRQSWTYSQRMPVPGCPGRHGAP